MKKFKRSKYSRQEPIEEKKKGISKEAWFAIFIIAIMTLSAIGFIYSPSETTEIYKGFKLVQLPGTTKWGIEIDGKVIEFYNPPAAAENIPFDPEAARRLTAARQLYITFNPEEENLEPIDLVRFDVSRIMMENGNVYIASGMTKNTTTYALPQIECINATMYIPVLLLKTGNETKISLENNCIVAQASTPYDFTLIRDRILYMKFGVIE